MAAYHRLWGVSEAYADSLLKSWDQIARIPEIKPPTVILSGEHGKLTPYQARVMHTQIPSFIASKLAHM